MSDEEYHIKEDAKEKDAVAEVIMVSIKAKKLADESLSVIDMMIGTLFQVRGLISAEPVLATELCDDLDQMFDLSDKMVRKLNSVKKKKKVKKNE